MKKIYLFMLSLLSICLASCDEDFASLFGPQSNLQESILQVSDVTVATLEKSIAIDNYLDVQGADSDTVKIGKITVAEGKMPANTVMDAQVEFSTDESFENAISLDAEVNAENEILVSPSALQDAYYNNVTRNPKATTLYVRSILYTITNEASTAIVGKPGENYFDVHAVSFTPKDMHLVIENAYYYVGTLTQGQEYKFTNSGVDPYDDPVFTCTIPASGADWHWFRIAGESEYTDGKIDWDKENSILSSICPVTGDDTALEGKCMNGTKSWHLDEVANPGAKYKITVNVMDMTIQITPIAAVPEYYIVGRQNNWQMSTVSACYPTSPSTISYTSYFTNAWDCRIATPTNALAGTWDSDFGAKENGCTDAQGTLVENCSNCIASPAAGYYTLHADFDAMTYSWEPVEGTPVSYDKIGIVGAGDDWDNDIFMTKVEGSSDLGGNDTHNWSALNVTLKAATWGVKFRANAGWDVNWGDPSATTAGKYIYGAGTQGGDNIPFTEGGVYNIYFNDITGQFFFVKQ